MRKLSILALILVVSALGAACSSNTSETYTNVTAGTSGGKTVSGKVIEFTDDSVMVETVTGRETLALNSETQGRELLQVGARLAFAFQRSSGRGEPVVTQITTSVEPEADDD